jgi:hypothetical protein
MKENYPDRDLIGIETAYDRVVEIRDDDLTAFNNLSELFIGGRKVEKIPANSTDIAITDKEGDVNYNATNLYILMDIGGGTLEWRTVALAAF